MINKLGDFTIFGFTKKPVHLFQHEIIDRLEIVPKFIDFGDAGRLFFYTTYGQVAESETDILLKLGFVRSRSYGGLSAQQIYEHKLIGLDFVEQNELHGNALIAFISKIEPKFSIYKTLMAVPQLYYSASREGIICSDRMKAIVWAMDRIELNDDILPMHFLFRTVIGTSTYIRNIYRMLSGQLMKWKDNNIDLHLVRDLDFINRNVYKKVDSNSLNTLYGALYDVIGFYSEQVNNTGNNIGTFLSGGVDSSLIQYILNEINHHKTTFSFSFSPKATSFAFELDYAQKASQHFHTEHTFVNFNQDEYPKLLTDTIDALSYPPLLPSEPGICAVVKYIHNENIPIRYYFLGGGAEPSFGYTYAKKIKITQYLAQIPAFADFLIFLGRLLNPMNAYGHILSSRGMRIKNVNNPTSLYSPLNSYDVYIEPINVFSCFGEKMTMQALEDRRNLANQYINSSHILEKAAVLDMVTDSYDLDVERNQIFLSNYRETITPFTDDEIIRIGFNFDPDIRYIKGFNEKYLLKSLLYQKAGLTTAWKPKGGAQFFEDFYEWMRIGSLRPLVDDIKLPGYINRNEFEKLAEKPDIFLWSLLVLDLFQKRVINTHV